MSQDEDAIRNALERAAVVSRNGVFRNLVRTYACARRSEFVRRCVSLPRETDGRKETRAETPNDSKGRKGTRRWKLYGRPNCAMHIEEDCRFSSLLERASLRGSDRIGKRFSVIARIFLRVKSPTNISSLFLVPLLQLIEIARSSLYFLLI